MKRILLALAVLVGLSLLCAWQQQNFGGLPSGWTTNGKIAQMNGTGTVNCAATTFGIQFLTSGGTNQGCIYLPSVGGVAIGNRSAAANEQVYLAVSSSEAMRIANNLRVGWSSSTPDAAGLDTYLTRSTAGVTQLNASGTFTALSIQATLFANLGTPADGMFVYCSDCTVANPCAGVGSGALAKRLNGAWVCN